jgi:hypothetical protein
MATYFEKMTWEGMFKRFKVNTREEIEQKTYRDIVVEYELTMMQKKWVSL